MATASTLRTLRVGGQLDPAWLASSIQWTHVRATATLSRPDDGAPVVDPTNNAHEHPLTVANTLTAAQADGQWATAPLKPTISTGADLALAPSGLVWEITLEIKRGATWHEVITYTVAPSGDRDYDGEGELITVDGVDCIDVNALIPPPVSLPPSSIFEDAVLEVLADNPAAIAADLSVTRDATTVTVASSTGTDAVLPAATTSLAGQLTAADKAKLDGIEAGATADQVAAEVPVTPGGGLVATNAQAALAEHQGDIDGINATLAAATSTSAGASDAGKLVELNGSGLVGPSILPGPTVVDAVNGFASSVVPTSAPLGSDLVVKNVGVSGEAVRFWAYPKTSTLLWRSYSPEHPDIEVPLPAGLLPPFPTWNLDDPPSSGAWSDQSAANQSLVITGSPVVSATQVMLSTGQQLTRLTGPTTDTYRITIDLQLGATPTASHRIVTTKTTSAATSPGIELVVFNATGLIFATISNGATSTSTAGITIGSTRSVVVLEKTATELRLTAANSTVVKARQTLTATSDGTLNVNGQVSGANTAPLTIFSISIQEGI